MKTKAARKAKAARPPFPSFEEWEAQDRKEGFLEAEPVRLCDIPGAFFEGERRRHEHELNISLRRYVNAEAAHQHFLESALVSLQNSKNPEGPRNALTELMGACFDCLKSGGHIPSGRSALLQAVRAADPDKRIVRYIPGEGNKLNDRMGKVLFKKQDGTDGMMSLPAISQWLLVRKKKH